jgi:hypothetical protein
MSVRLLLSCGGCDATAEVGPLRRRYVSVFGGNLCRVTTDDPEALAPDGWVMWDPYTHCTYCPECWASIETRTT